MNKNILLIGGSHGIGQAIVEQLHDDHNLIVAARTKENLDGLNVKYIPFDVTSDSLDVLQLPDKIHGFVYCPGSINLKPFKMMSLETFQEDMQVNFFSMVGVVKNILPKVAEGMLAWSFSVPWR